ISGGTVYAYGGAYYNDENDYYVGGAGIGSGDSYGYGTINITGGNIVAEETLTELADNNGDTIPDGYISDIGYGYYGYNSPSTVNISATSSPIYFGSGDTTANTAYGVTPTSGTVYENNGSDWSTYPVYVYTSELTFTPEYTLSAVLSDSTKTYYNANDEFSVDIVVGSDYKNANVGSLQFALDGDWFTLKSVTPVQGTASVNTTDASASMTGLNTDVDSTGTVIATAVLKVNSDITTTKDAEISFNTAGTNIITPTSSSSEITPATMTGTTVDIYNLKVTFNKGNSTFGSDDVTAAYVKYNETGLYKDNTYNTAVSVPTPTANAGYRLAAGTADEPLWSDGTNTYTDNSAVEGTAFTADTTLTVQTVKQYTVTISPADSSKGILYKDGTAVTADTAYTVDENSTIADLNLTFVTADNTSYMLTGVTLDGTTEAAAAAFDTTYITADTAISPVIEPNSFSFEFVKEDQEFSGLLNGVTNGDTVSYGTDVTFTSTPVSGAAVYSVYYTVGDDLTTYSLTPDSSDIYTIDGTAILGDIKVYINAKKYHKITLSQGEGNEMTDITGYVWDGLAGIYKTVPGLGTGAETYTASEISAAPSETEGYRLAADSADEPLWTDGTNYYTTAALTGSQTFTEDTALTAVSVKQYTVTFTNDGNGTVEETSRVVDTGSTLGTLPKVNPADYYTFSG
ncbi:MAG: hypothetical protein LUD77_06960, partial [Clostridiales bacterium]|nr:hypothetical protein [Clostridiales bacterium]